MLIGILLGISISVSLASIILIFTTATGLIAENPATGAVIGTTTTASYAAIALVASLIITYILFLFIKNKPSS